jgi:hypothetical protein
MFLTVQLIYVAISDLTLQSCHKYIKFKQQSYKISYQKTGSTSVEAKRHHPTIATPISAWYPGNS